MSVYTFKAKSTPGQTVAKRNAAVQEQLRARLAQCPDMESFDRWCASADMPEHLRTHLMQFLPASVRASEPPCEG